MLGHHDKTLTLARSVALAGICGGLAIVMPFTLVDTIAVNTGIAAGLYGGYRRGKKTCCGRRGHREGGEFPSVRHSIAPG